MNKRLSLLIIVMTLLLAGLVSIQIYWIKNAIALREQQFDQNVSEALNKVALKLERQDMATFIFNEFYSHGNPDLLLDRKFRLIHNRLTRSFNNDIESLLDELKKAESSGKNNLLKNYAGKDGTIIMVDTAAECDHTGTITIQVADSVCQIQLSTNSRERLLHSVNEQMQKLNQRRALVNEVFFQFFSNERSIHDRIPQEQMDDIIKNALASEGIEAPFEYVVASQFGQAIAVSDNFDRNDVRSAHRITLFPNDLFSEHNYLFVQFPSRHAYIFKSLGVMSLSSMGLILVISLFFAYTIHIIFRQKKLSDMKTDFVNNLTHELKTPISTISLASEMLRDSRVSTDPSRIQKYAGVIHEENKRLGSHVEKVLEMAALDRGKTKLKLTEVNVHELINKAIGNMSLQLEEKNSQLQTNFNAKDQHAHVDVTHFTNIVTNLLDNALKYSKETPQISISTRDTTGGILIIVSDKGIGMSKDAQKKVFERFYRVPTGNVHNVKGFGLGLSYVKAMVEAHGGNIKLKSELNKGTTFEIFIPHFNHD